MFDDLDSFYRSDSSLDLLKSLLKAINPDVGFELHTRSDLPIGSGLGGSASYAVAVIGCFNQLRRDRWNKYEISEMAYHAEK